MHDTKSEYNNIKKIKFKHCRVACLILLYCASVFFIFFFVTIKICELFNEYKTGTTLDNQELIKRGDHQCIISYALSPWTIQTLEIIHYIYLRRRDVVWVTVLCCQKDMGPLAWISRSKHCPNHLTTRPPI